jgi:tetratricopeptide (TPR) repeat protein
VLEAAEAAGREAIRLKPDAAAQYRLGNVLAARAKHDEAVATYREAIRLKPDYADAHCRLGLTRWKQGKLDEAIAECRKAIQLQPDLVEAHLNLGNSLADQGQSDEAIAAFRKAIRLKPDYADAHYNLGISLNEQGKLDEAIAAYREALRLKPDFTDAHGNLGNSLRDAGKLDEAIAEYREAIRLNPNSASSHINLGVLFCERSRDYPAAEREFRKAIELDPAKANTLANLGKTLLLQNKLDEAIVVLREATGLKPDLDFAHNNLGNALANQGKLDEAIAEYRKAAQIKPDIAGYRINLGAALAARGKSEEAVREYHEAIRLEPNYADAHYILGQALSKQGKLDKAIGEYRTAIRLKPDNAQAYCNLGAILCDAKRDYPAAEAAFREAIRLKPDLANAHGNLGEALKNQGNVEEALNSFRRAAALSPPGSPFAQSMASTISQIEKKVAVPRRLPAILRGEEEPGNNAQRLAFARMAYERKYYVAGARLWAQALESDPTLADDRQAQHRYRAACASALAATRRGEDEPPPDDAAKAKLRRQALDWLRAELTTWAKLLESGPPQARPAIAQTLYRWKQDTDLAVIRNGEALAKLPAEEQQAWRTLWAQVDALQKRASTSGAKETKPDDHAQVRAGAAPADPKPFPQPSVARQEPRLSVLPTPNVESGNPEVLASIHKRAHELAGSKPREAEPLFRRALEGYRKIEGPDGALSLDLTMDLASLLDRTGRGALAGPLFGEAVDRARKRFGPDDPRTAGMIAASGISLLQQGKWTEAESVLRDCLAIRQKTQPEEWSTFNTHSMLGDSLLGQKKYAEAEPLILSGYAGLKAREGKIPPPGKPRLADAAERVVRLYEAWGKPEQAAEWRAKLAKPTDGTRNEP